MTDPNAEGPQNSRPFWNRRINGLRYIFSAAAIVGGAVIAIRAANGLGEGAAGTLLLVGGLLVILLGIASIPFYRWMDKRRL